MKQKVIRFKNLPTRAPTSTTLLIYLFMKVEHWPGWAQGACYTVVGFLWVAFIFACFNEVQIEIFKDSNDNLL